MCVVCMASKGLCVKNIWRVEGTMQRVGKKGHKFELSDTLIRCG